MWGFSFEGKEKEKEKGDMPTWGLGSLFTPPSMSFAKFGPRGSGPTFEKDSKSNNLTKVFFFFSFFFLMTILILTLCFNVIGEEKKRDKGKNKGMKKKKKKLPFDMFGNGRNLEHKFLSYFLSSFLDSSFF